MKNKRNKGITLIALVVTIIVLLILAGISIAMLSGNNGILQRASEAKRTAERADAKEQAQLDILAWQSDKISKGENSDLNDTVIKGILTGKSYVKTADTTSFTTKNGEYEISYSELYQSNSSNNNDNDTLEETDYPYKTPYIPIGFEHTGSENWNHGYTITGKTNTANAGDEFVWVPCVLDQSAVKEGDTVQTFGKIMTGKYNSDDLIVHPASGTYEDVYDEDSTVADIKTSVGTYGGFYIAKYEAGITGTTDNNLLTTKTATDGSVKPLSQAGVGVWNYITRANSLIVAKSMIPESTGAKSTLISGECWDTTLAWITSTADSAYAENSSNKGNYNINPPENGYPENGLTTGQYGTNTNNIFDMGGNAFEWTSENGLYEEYDEEYEQIYTDHRVVARGGSCDTIGSNTPAAFRTGWYESEHNCYSFRVILYK